jgi:F0F1-type ATP synthase assembly protein I
MEKWKQYGRNIKTGFSFSTVGIEMALSVGLGYLLGGWFDGWLDTSPWGMLAFVLLGSAAGFYNLFRSTKKLRAQADE